jgi:hypothetical protein
MTESWFCLTVTFLAQPCGDSGFGFGFYLRCVLGKALRTPALTGGQWFVTHAQTAHR